MYDRGPPTSYEVIDEWADGVGWFAHPAETGQRASHAVVGDDGGVWIFDPLDAPGIDDLLGTLGAVAGVVVLSNYHVRDADAIADRHGVPVYLPAWLSRAATRLDGPTERVTDAIGASGFSVRRCAPLPGWTEAVAYRDSDGTVYVPDVLGTAPPFTVGAERLGVYLLCRLRPPRAAFAGVRPRRLLVGHGSGLFDDAQRALEASLSGARRRFPRALLTSGASQLRALVAALGE
jgi:hypothetical protein